MTDGIIYFLWGSAHATQLLVSLWSLRRHYAGPVAILTPDPPPSPAHLIARDPRLQTTVGFVPLCAGRRNGAHCTKTWIHRHTPFDRTIFLDADTLVAGTLEALWPQQNAPIWTHWPKWKAFGSPVEARIRRFAAEAKCEHLLEKCGAWPAINTGVFSFHRDDAALEPIHELCLRGRQVFIPDECAVQLLAMHHPHQLLDDRWNLSPRHGSEGGRADPRVIHAHGGKVLQPWIKARWLATLRAAWDLDLGGVRMWMPSWDREVYLPLLPETT